MSLLESDSLPPSPHLLSYAALQTLAFGSFSKAQYVDLFLRLFCEACGVRSHKLENNHYDLICKKDANICPFAVGDKRASIVVHGVHLFEKIDMEKGWTADFQRDFEGFLVQGQIALGSGPKTCHFQAFTLDVERAELSLRCSLDLQLDEDTKSSLQSVLDGRAVRGQPAVEWGAARGQSTLRINHISGPHQPTSGSLANGCMTHALADAMELVLRVSHGHKGLERDQQCIHATRAAKRTIKSDTNEQGERLRMFVQLWLLKAMSETVPVALICPFQEALQRAKASLSPCRSTQGGASPAVPAGDAAEGFTKQQLVYTPRLGTNGAPRPSWGSFGGGKLNAK